MRLTIECDVPKPQRAVAEMALQQLADKIREWMQCPSGKKDVSAMLEQEVLALAAAFGEASSK